MTKKPLPHAKRGRKPRNIPGSNPRGFTGAMFAGPAGHKEGVKLTRKREEIRVRQMKAWDMWLGGATFEQIGAQLKVSGKTAWYDCVAWRDALDAKGLVTAEMRLSRQFATLDKVRLTHYLKRGDKASAEIILKTLDHEAKLAGIYAKPKDAVPVEQVFSFLRDITALFMDLVADSDLRRQFASGLRRRIGPLTSDVPIQAVPSTTEVHAPAP